MTHPISDQQLDLDEIETRAAAVYEYATVTDTEGQTAADQLAGTDVPALVSEVRRQRAELEARTEDLASADNPTHLRWGLNGVLWGDDDSVIVLLSGPDREPYWLELDPERAAVLREDLAGPDEEQQATARCGHDIETALGTYPCERDTDHDGDCDERTEAEYAAEGSGH